MPEIQYPAAEYRFNMQIQSCQPIFEHLPLNECHLKKHRIDIWRFSLLKIPKSYKTILSHEEQKRGDRFHFPIHRRRHLAAHTYVRQILARYLNLPAQEIEFSYNAHGKPEITHHALLQFNLSHSKDLALLAVSMNHPVGIDLEFFSARPYEGIGSHIFSLDENYALQHLSNPMKPLGFFHLWSQKEALIKACGLGLSYPTKQLTLPLIPPVDETIYDALHKTHWRILSFMPTVACCAAVCVHPGTTRIRFADVTES